MDTISHAAWGATIIRKRPELWWAAFFGALPDLIPAAFGVLRYGARFRHMISDIKAAGVDSGSYLTVYRWCHSLLPIGAVTAVLAVIDWRYALLTLPYYLHLLLDVPTHHGEWATRLLYPLSDVHIEGRDWWKHRWFSVANWTALIVANLVIVVWL